MPTLIPVARQEGAPDTFLYLCSECPNAAFGARRITENVSEQQIKQINSEFREHCEAKHPGAPVVELEAKE